jgi:hypothetical protein
MQYASNQCVLVPESHLNIALFLLYCPVLLNEAAFRLSVLTSILLCPYLLISASLFTIRRYCNSRFRERSTEPWTKQAHCIKYETEYLTVMTDDTKWDSGFTVLCITIPCDRYFKPWNILKRSADTLWSLWSVFVWIFKSVRYISIWEFILFVGQIC